MWSTQWYHENGAITKLILQTSKFNITEFKKSVEGHRINNDQASIQMQAFLFQNW